MKTILMSIKPKYVADILNGIKTLEIRKKFPKDYVGWVYIYCTKDENKKLYFSTFHGKYMVAKYVDRKHKVLNGKVVARFWCDKVETFRCNVIGNLKDGFFKAEPYCKEIGDGTARYNCDDEFESTLKNAQLTNKELAQYLGDKNYPYFGHYVFNAIHITKLEIFDKPKELSEFYKVGYEEECEKANGKDENWFKENNMRKRLTTNYNIALKYQLTRAPQSWCYVEV